MRFRSEKAAGGFAILLAACASLDGLTDGPPDTQVDAAADATVDAVTADAALDAGRESCPPMPGNAAAPTVAASCAASDGCAPSPFDASVLQWRPLPHESACSAAQIDAFDVACFGADAGNASCNAFKANNAACTKCIVNPRPGGDLGAILVFPGLSVTIINVGACIAAIDPCAIDCAMAVQLLAECETRACAPACAGAPTIAQLDCFQQAASCPCQAYSHVVTSCLAALQNGPSPAAQCDPPGASLDDNLKAAAKVLCGNGA